VSTDIAALREALAKAAEREHQELVALRAENAWLRAQVMHCMCPPLGEDPPISRHPHLSPG
jgi:hypothetical protein